MKECRLCKKTYRGRSDKIFCSVKCKSDYHIRLERATHKATKRIDKILHRNRSILLELMGKNKTQLKTTKGLLDNKKFNYQYFTGLYRNTKGKTIYRVYDFSYTFFTDDGVLIMRNKVG